MKNLHEKKAFDLTHLAAYQEPDRFIQRCANIDYDTKGFAARILMYLDLGIVIDTVSGGGYIWNGSYWVYGGARNLILQSVGGAVKQALQNHAATLEDAERKELVKYLATINNNANYVSQAIAMLPEFQGITMDINSFINNNLHLVNAPNGTVNLKTGEVKPHDMDDMMLGMTGIELNPSKELASKTVPQVWEWMVGNAPKTAAFFYQTFHVPDETGAENLDRVRYALCVMANLLNGDTSLQKFFIMKGKGGNGKGTLDRLMLLLFGSYGKTADPLMFTSKGAARVFRQVGSFIGKRFIAIPEIPRTAQMNASFVKNWTGEDFIPYTNLYEAESEMKPHSTLVFSINHNMHVDEYGPAMKRRLVLFKTMNRASQVKGGENKNLVNELIEAEGKAFGSVLVRLSYALLNNEVSMPPRIAEDSIEYIKKDNFIQEFFDNCTHVKLHSNEEPRMNTIMPINELYAYAKKYNAVFGSGVHGRFMNYQAFIQALEDLEGYPAPIWGPYEGNQFDPIDTKGMVDFMPDVMMTERGLKSVQQNSNYEPEVYVPQREESTGTDEPIVNMAKRIFQEQPDLGMGNDDDK